MEENEGVQKRAHRFLLRDITIYRVDEDEGRGAGVGGV